MEVDGSVSSRREGMSTSLPPSGSRSWETRSRDRLGAPLPVLPLLPLPAARSQAEPAPATAHFGATAPLGAWPSGQGEVPSARSGTSSQGRRGLGTNRCGMWGTPRPGVGVPKDPPQEPRVSGNNLGAGRLSLQQAFLLAGSCRTPNAQTPPPQTPQIPPPPVPKMQGASRSGSGSADTRWGYEGALSSSPRGL